MSNFRIALCTLWFLALKAIRFGAPKIANLHTYPLRSICRRDLDMAAPSPWLLHPLSLLPVAFCLFLSNVVFNTLTIRPSQADFDELARAVLTIIIAILGYMAGLAITAVSIKVGREIGPSWSSVKRRCRRARKECAQWLGQQWTMQWNECAAKHD